MYVDADILFATLKAGDRHTDFAHKIMEEDHLYTSTITLVELEIVVKRELSNEMSTTIQSVVRHKFPRLKILPLTPETHQKSQELRQKYGLGIFDAIHAATALQGDKRIASTDHIYDSIPKLTRRGPPDETKQA